MWCQPEAGCLGVGRATRELDLFPRVSPQGAAWPCFLAPECPRGLWDGKSLWFQWIQETESLECGLPGEGRSLFLEEGLFNTQLCPSSPWKWQRGTNKERAKPWPVWLSW